LRVGADSFGSDLNPIAVLLNKVVIEYIPKYGRRLANEVQRWGDWVKREAQNDLADYYPPDPDGAIPIAYLWARTVQCEGPSCGVEIPLLRSSCLAQKGRRSAFLRLVGNTKEKRVDIGVVTGDVDTSVPSGTIKLGSATCPVCGYTTPVARVREQLKERHGGSRDARLLCVVTTRPHVVGKNYRAPTPLDATAYERAAAELKRRIAAHKGVGELTLIPSERPPTDGTGSRGGGYRTRKYGIDSFAEFFSARQLLEHVVLGEKIRQVAKTLTPAPDSGFAEAVVACLALCADRQVDRDSAFCRWISQTEAVGYTFGRQAIPMLWDFVESPALSSSGGWSGSIEDLREMLEAQTAGLANCPPGSAVQASATKHPLPDDSAQCLITDPPYYDAVPYAELSDFFFVWLKRILGRATLVASPSSLTPRDDECVVNLAEGKDRDYFCRTMLLALGEARRVVQPSGIGVVVFAHKTTAGWEAQLQAMRDAGWTVTASWPIDTERPGRLRAQNSAALASSVHLVCRPRENSDGSIRTEAVGDWRDVLDELPRRIHNWMPRLAKEGVVGADAIFACLGPALEIFTQYSRVEKASGSDVSLREYLEQVWAAVAKEALAMIFSGADATGFEEDARLTAMWLWTLSTGAPYGNSVAMTEDAEPGEDDEDESATTKSKVSGFLLEYDAARKIAQGLGAHLDTLSTLVEVKGASVRLLPVAERTRSLFQKGEAAAPTDRGKATKRKKSGQLSLGFVADLEEAEESGGWSETGAPQKGETVLDRVHQAMILFGAGRGEALKRFLVDDGVGRDNRFWRLAQAFSALYPSSTDEKRWVDGVLARKKSLGF
jgi:adenine-specific DNA methylase